MIDVAVSSSSEMPPERGPTRKRRRVVISCTECHRRKQKCDRELPCGNCRARSKESRCTYEAGAPTAREFEIQSSFYAQSIRDSGSSSMNGESLSSVASELGYSQTSTSTLCFLQKIERAGLDDSENASTGPIPRPQRQESFAVREKYKGLIRLLPARTYLDEVLGMFFSEFNWQYEIIQEQLFYQQLQQWNNLPFKLLSAQGPEGLPPDLRVFPAVLFQILATTLLILPEELHSQFDALKYAASMTLEDLAQDYSESGNAILNLFGKKSLSVTSVQAQFLRAAFLKYTAHITESWHMIGITIRDAQELGMHRDHFDPRPASSDVEDVLENQWTIERRRLIYMTLAIWDIHMCVLLGRPGTLDWRHGLPSLPIDAPTPMIRSKTPVIPRDEDRDPPTPITRGLHVYQVICCLRDIQDLESEGPCPKDFSKVDKVHERIIEADKNRPAVFRIENPDTRWDGKAGLGWLQSGRYFVEQMHTFALMALHRPYIFHREKSRYAALSASIQMLEVQRQSFAGLPPKSWRNWHLFYGNFDAVILIATIYILFPYEQPELRDAALQHCRWAVERFTTIKDQNPLANSAFGVLKAVVARLIKATANCAPPSTATTGRSETPRSTGTTAEATPTSTTSKMSSVSDPTATTILPNASTFLGEPSSLSYPSTSIPNAWAAPQTGNGFSTLAPLCAMRDLLYNDLSVNVEGDGMPRLDLDAFSNDISWQFEGGFGEDTVWQLLNQYPAGGGEEPW